MRLSAPARAVYKELKRRGALSGWVSAQHDVLAGVTCMSVSSARAAIYELLGAGVIISAGRCKGKKYKVR